MEARAQYAVVENGAWQRYFSHWAAGRVVDDLLPGPAAATRCFRAQRKIEEWLDDVWCEGAALVDHDRRVLLWFGFADSWADHRAARAVLARTWPGWDDRFAHDGMGDLTHHLGIGRDLTRAPGWFETFQPVEFAGGESTEPWSVVSLRLPDESVRAWGSAWEPIEHLACGPALIDLLPASPATPAPTDMPYGGVHFDPRARTVSLWAVQTVTGVHDRPLPDWDGWTLDFHGDDHTRQAAVLPADFAFPHLPLATALRRLGTGLGTPPPDLTPLLARAHGRTRPRGHHPRAEPRRTGGPRAGRPHPGRTGRAAHGT
ncbi:MULTISPECIES: hypothetical protein [Streptomyces]|uniref:hypothetical protein n=1 Tax=Streptomyces TaxID=1883 RepID=UPI00081EF4D8|nr:MULTISPECIES: hypothetical protein [unclassified Streptomyces]MYQ93062.1 hypothetical protein [Streptomyces sp. SID4946]SCF78854.1 hypothetical protein GA0115256_118142 [Streptomyces sp. DconLS]SCF84349.1 hypothetical protein GA0115258_114078 [Streptomyces sp. LamerLS-31b]